MGKKRIAHSNVPDLVKVEVKDEIASDSNVLMARDRFRGALRELLRHSDEESAESSDEVPLNDYRAMSKKTETSFRQKQTPTPGRKLKRRRPFSVDPSYHHTYVMKLFDRSVDLAQFQEDTPLYPICRAWMSNQPRNPNLIVKQRSPSPDPEAPPTENTNVTINNLFDENGEIREISCLPPALPSEEAFPRNRIPSPIPHKTEELNLDYEGQTLKTKEMLMKEHRQHWCKVRRKWHQQAHKNERRFCESATILSTIFKRAQSEFD